ncbi:MAG: protoporphyrinogen oxidase [Nitrospiraceae bacterium]|nr:protoporphyrinogen oxidase [Nitrospiraceae bacterium]
MVRAAIAGGGISGLSLACMLKRKGPVEPVVLEALERPGGKIRTEKADGFLCEWGVNGFLDNRARTLELASMLSLKTVRSSDAARNRFIWLDGKLRRMPENPKEFLRSDVLSIGGKLRIAMEPFIKPNPGDETLAVFARRRLGREAYENLIDPMASGIFAGDPEKMSVASCFPKIKKIERKYGSLIKGMIKLGREAKKAGKGPVGAGPGGALTSFSGGMEEIITALKGQLDGGLRLRSRAVSLEKKGKGYKIHLADGGSVEADAVALACPAYESAGILRDFDAELSRMIGGIEYPALSVVSVAFRMEKINFPVDSFGFLVPFKEKRRILGTLFDSSIFPERAPEGFLLLRVMIGGMRAQDAAMMDEEKLLNAAMDELGGILGLRAEPDFYRIFRHEKAIPQYPLGHGRMVEEMESRLAENHKGLYITGNAFRGIALNDCIENSFKLAEKIVREATG